MVIKIIIVLIFAFALLIGIVVFALFHVIGLIRARGVPFISLRKWQLDLIGKHIKLGPDDRVVDLGCGDGRVLRMFENQRVKDLAGYEVNLWAYLLAKIKNRFLKSKSKIYFKNFKKIDLSQYNVIFCYLLDYYMASLREKFDKELKPGAKVISYAFPIENWHKPEIIYTNEKNKKTGRIFVYKILP